jgi:hypothetical protein
MTKAERGMLEKALARLGEAEGALKLALREVMPDTDEHGDIKTMIFFSRAAQATIENKLKRK